jgi:hypothetical protein
VTAEVIPHPSLLAILHLQERIEEAERYLSGLEEMYAGLRDGTRPWQEWDEGLTCPERQEAAVDECGMAMDAARAELAELEAQWGDRG